MSDATTTNREATIASVVSALQKAFGDRACEVAERQVEAAAQDALEIWTLILTKLRSNQDRQG